MVEFGRQIGSRNGGTGTRIDERQTFTTFSFSSSEWTPNLISQHMLCITLLFPLSFDSGDAAMHNVSISISSPPLQAVLKNGAKR